MNDPFGNSSHSAQTVTSVFAEHYAKGQISGSRGGMYEDDYLLGCCAV
jgi:hypothetical protein